MSGWVAGAVVVGAVAGGAIQANGAKKAAGIQAASADAATQAQLDQYNQTREDQAPYRALATEVGLPGIRNFLSSNNNQLTPAQVMADPGYQFGVDQGNKGIQGTAAARGGLYSGATLKALSKFNGDYATGRYNDSYNRMETNRTNQFNRFATAAGIGQTANNQVAQAGMNFANNAGGNMIGAGNAQGAAALASGNAWGNALNQGISSYGKYMGGQQGIDASGAGSLYGSGANGSLNGVYGVYGD